MENSNTDEIDGDLEELVEEKVDEVYNYDISDIFIMWFNGAVVSLVLGFFLFLHPLLFAIPMFIIGPLAIGLLIDMTGGSIR